MDTKEYQEAQEIIKQIDLDAENLNDEIYYEISNLLELSDNNIIAKQYIEQNQDTIFEKRPDLLYYYVNNEIVKNFVDKLKKDSKEYETIKNGLKQYLTEDLDKIYDNSPILELYSKDLLKDQEFTTLLNDDLKTKNHWLFLPPTSEKSIFIKYFIDENRDYINQFLTENPSYLIDRSTNIVVQNFVDNLQKDSKKYDIIKSELTKYFKDHPKEVISRLNTSIIKLCSEDLLKDQKFKISLDNDLKKPENNWFILSQLNENNSFIKDFVKNNLEDINKILEANPDYIENYKDSKVVKQYELQKLQKNNTLLEEVGQDLSSIILSNSSTKERK